MAPARACALFLVAVYAHGRRLTSLPMSSATKPATVCLACNGERFVDRPITGGWYEEKFVRELCEECCGTGLSTMSDEELDELADSLDCAGCLSAPAVAVIDSRALCERCASDASAAFARSEDSGVDLLSGFSPSARRQSRAAV
jgi:hypothetical protein